MGYGLWPISKYRIQSGVGMVFGANPQEDFNPESRDAHPEGLLKWGSEMGWA